MNPTRTDARTSIRARAGTLISRLKHEEEGAETAEYAIVIMAAVALAGVLVMVVQSDAVSSIIEDLVVSAFSA